MDSLQRAWCTEKRSWKNLVRRCNLLCRDLHQIFIPFHHHAMGSTILLTCFAITAKFSKWKCKFREKGRKKRGSVEGERARNYSHFFHSLDPQSTLTWCCLRDEIAVIMSNKLNEWTTLLHHCPRCSQGTHNNLSFYTLHKKSLLNCLQCLKWGGREEAKQPRIKLLHKQLGQQKERRQRSVDDDSFLCLLFYFVFAPFLCLSIESVGLFKLDWC